MPTSVDQPLTYFAVTVDVDPDVNLPVPGESYAISHPVEKGEARFNSCAKGLHAIVKMLNDMNVPGTFFIEARTAERLEADFGLDLKKLLNDHEVGSHAYKHEDLLGKDSGKPLSKDEMSEAIRTGLEKLRDITGRSINGFRAPYVRINDDLAEVLTEIGFEYDSSVTKKWRLESPVPLQPYYYFEERDRENANPQALVEVPLPELILPAGEKVTSYLWPFLEGDMPFSRYNEALAMVASLPPSDSLVLLATHPWHLVETYKNGVLSESEHTGFILKFGSQLQDLKTKKNMKFTTISDYLEKWHSRSQRRDLDVLLG